MISGLMSKLKTTQPGTDEGWRDPALVPLREAQRENAESLAALEREWEALEHRGDFAADKRREDLRAVMPPLYEKRDLLAIRITAGEERERIVNDLLQVHAQQTALLQAKLEGIADTVAVPPDAVFLTFHRQNRLTEQLRVALFALTDSPDLAREWDAVQALRSFWFDQAKERERLFNRLLGPGMRPRAEVPPWQGLLQRLAELSRCVKE